MRFYQLNPWIVTAAILTVYGTGSHLFAQEPADSLKELKRENEALRQEIKSVKEEFNIRLKNLEDQLAHKGPITNSAGQVTAQEADWKSKEVASRFKIPEWVTSVNLLGDLRIRYDGIYAPDKDFVTRTRIRPRLRLGAIATLKDDLEIGFRLASTPTVGRDSGGDPISTQHTFEDNASRKPIGVDWAFARWTPIDTPKWRGSFTLGKMENPPNYTEDVFDVDYTPEGLAEQFSFKPNANHTMSTYFGQYMLDELQFSGKDPYLFLEQLRLDSKWGQRINTSLGVSGLSITSPESLTTTSVPDSNHGNTRTPLITTNNATTGGALVNEYELLIADASIAYNLDAFPLYKGPFPIKLFGEYIHNFGASQDNIAYSFGPSFGGLTRNGKIQKGNWEVSYRYQELHGDANYEELTASDNGAFYRSRPVGEPASGSFRPQFLNGLNLRGHAFRLTYAATDSLVFDARAWLNQPINVSSAADKVEGLRFVFDFIWRF